MTILIAALKDRYWARRASGIPRALIGSLTHDSRGFTLVEVLVSVGILGIILGTVGTAIFQALASERTIATDGRAIHELRRGLNWFARDAARAADTNLPGDGSIADSVKLEWTDRYGDMAPISHTVTYALADTDGDGIDDSLLRNIDGVAHTVARRVVPGSLGFTRSARTLTAEISVSGPGIEPRTMSLSAFMRTSP